MSDTPETKPARSPRKLKILSIAAALVLVVLAVLVVAKPFSSSNAAAKQSKDPYALTFDGSDFSGKEATAPVKTEPVAQRDPEEQLASACASCAKKHVVAALPAASTTTHVAKGAPTTAELRKALKQQHQSAKAGSAGRTTLTSDGTAIAPLNAPSAVQNVVAAGNAIKNYPYIWGGGHGSFQDNGYDCSGSVSYALKGAGLVSSPMVAADFMSYGEPGPGKWISIYASEGHVFMFVGGIRFDTSYRDGPYGSRWQDNDRPLGGFTVRHPTGL